MRYRVLTGPASGWVDENAPGLVVEAEDAVFPAGVVVFTDTTGRFLRAFAPGSWREVIRLSEEEESA